MQKITTVAALKSAIQQLEYKQAKEWPVLKEQFLITYENLKPLNVLKNTFNELTTSPDVKKSLLDTTIGLTAGYLTKAVIIGVSRNPVKIILATFLQLGITNIVAKHPERLKLMASGIVNFFSKKIKSKSEDINECPV